MMESVRGRTGAARNELRSYAKIDAMNRPSAPPHGVLLEDARKAAKLSIREAARRSGISDAWWRAVVSGSQNGAPANGSPETVAAMARTVGVTPEQIATEGKNTDAAEALREILRSEGARANAPALPPPDVIHHDAEDAAAVLFPGDRAMQAIWRLPEPVEVREALVGELRRLRREVGNSGVSLAEDTA